jgi:hypothetical protein
MLSDLKTSIFSAKNTSLFLALATSPGATLPSNFGMAAPKIYQQKSFFSILFLGNN